MADDGTPDDTTTIARDDDYSVSDDDDDGGGGGGGGGGGSITVDNNRVERGQSVVLNIPIGSDDCESGECGDCQEDEEDCNATTTVPLTVINGLTKGPTLLILAGIHGSEYAPILASQELARKYYGTTTLESGTLILVNIANLPMFLDRSVYTSPIDNLNLNRVFPGRNSGTITERIAYFITSQLYPHTSLVMDIHSGDANEQLAPTYTAYYGNVKDNGDDEGSISKTTALSPKELMATSKRMAECFGSSLLVVEFQWEIVLGNTTGAIWSGAYANTQGIPSMDVEVARYDGNSEDSTIIQSVVAGIENVMTCLGMRTTAATTTKEISPPLLVRERHFLEAPMDGVWISEMNAGTLVEEGDRIGYVTDFHGLETLWNATSPTKGLLLIRFETPPVQKGDTVAVVAVLPPDVDHSALLAFGHGPTRSNEMSDNLGLVLTMVLTCLVSGGLGYMMGRNGGKYRRQRMNEKAEYQDVPHETEQRDGNRNLKHEEFEMKTFC